jgi:cytochrome c-type biogenesis protein CcsB
MNKWHVLLSESLPLLSKWLPVAVPGALVLWALSSLFSPRQNPTNFDVEAFGGLPMHANGHVQPIESLARISLLQLRQKETAETAPWAKDSKTLSATEWMMVMLMNPDRADTLPVFRIDNPDCKGLLGLPMNADPERKTDGKHYSWNQFKEKLETLNSEALRAERIDASARTPYDQAVVQLGGNARTYIRLQNILQPDSAQDWNAELESYLNHQEAGLAAVRAEQEKKDFDQQAFDRTMSDLERFKRMSNMSQEDLDPPRLVPPPHPEESRDGWISIGTALVDNARGDALPQAVTFYARMSDAYRAGRVAEFNQLVAGYRTALAAQFQPELSKVGHEMVFNRYEPFKKAMVPFVLALILVPIFWLNPVSFEWMRRLAFWLVVAGLCVHTSGLVFRMLLQNRPPVTNLYSSAIFIGFGAAILGVVLESVWRNGIGLVVSAALGFASLIIAHHLSLPGDTMEMLRAVLDTNLWLSTHVVVVTLGYASTFVAGFLAILYIVLGVFTPNLKRPLNAAAAAKFAETGVMPAGEIETGKSLAKMIYGIACFATLFSFVGTVLGGIWADQSWGRFWGWDPKENGALIIVLWNALILHARWGGLVRDRGLACLAVGGNIVTSWSWFGVNMLGIGLHSYGFTSGEAAWLIGFIVSQLVLIAFGSLPLHMWRSFRPASEPLPPTAPPLPA